MKTYHLGDVPSDMAEKIVLVLSARHQAAVVKGDIRFYSEWYGPHSKKILADNYDFWDVLGENALKGFVEGYRSAMIHNLEACA